MYQKDYHIHFVGIGGIGMSGIAEILISLGYTVSGSDLNSSSITERLKSLGAVIYQGHQKENIYRRLTKDSICDESISKEIFKENCKVPNVIVTSSAISKDNPEVLEAKSKAIPIIPRAEMLAELMRIKYSIAVSGAHGKTSTTSMIAQILNVAKFDPTVIIGGLLSTIGSNAFHGKGEYIVAEADESDGSFLKYAPAIAVVTNIDLEHLDFYKDIEDIKAKFIQFINSVPFYGLAVLCLDNEHIQNLIPKIQVRYTTFGHSAQADIQARDISFANSKSVFQVVRHGEPLGYVKLNLSGRHNISNALAAIAVALELKISFDTIKCALEKIEGVKRRMDKKGVKNGILVMDDYGHHPTEIRTTLMAIKENWPDKRVVVIFQPHRYSRTKALFDEFTRAFYQSDLLILLPIYAASEAKIEGVDSETLAVGIRSHGHKDVSFAPDTDTCLKMVMERVRPGDLVLTLGAGNVYTLGDKLLNIIKD
ncbi:MAG: UDP-N-acetylmuramate--L-alanine ligase [Desulfamplus sp.]|nr:UDP-N-acetylmuramate--L-alanine ligase [Desulfamplus sp.]